MEERKACALLRARFEAAGFHIAENRVFDEAGVRFEIDGFDPDRRVGYEYATREAGDGWDVDREVIAALAGRMARGELYVLVVDEAKAPDAPALDAVIDGFFAELRRRGVLPGAAPATAPVTAAAPAKAAAKATRPPPTPKPRKTGGRSAPRTKGKSRR